MLESYGPAAYVGTDIEHGVHVDQICDAGALHEIGDMKAILSDLETVALESDREAPGVFMEARMPAVFRENEVNGYKLFSMIKQRRTESVSSRDERLFEGLHAGRAPGSRARRSRLRPPSLNRRAAP
jgi:hypothetical protein